MSDEHNATVIGSDGNDIIHTPQLDRLAEAGTVFENCYCNSPLCVPSRLSFTAGKYISRIGAWNNEAWLLGDDTPSLPHLMNAAGYESVLCGKMHYDRERQYGFRQIPTRYNKHFKNGCGSRRKPDDRAPNAKMTGRFNEFYPGEDSRVLYGDRQVTQGTIDFLKNNTSSDRPFFMLCGYLAPHFPLIVPEEYWEPYKGKVPMPVIPDGHLESQPRNYQHLRAGFAVNNVPEETIRKGRELYYGLVQWMDTEIGKVLTALKDSEVAENTVVIYTTDHGENMGEHGMWWKNCMYDSATRVPLIVSWPARWKGGQRLTEVCSLVDLVQAIAEIGGADVPGDWDGDSLVPLLDTTGASWKNMAVSEYYSHPISSGYAMIRKDNLKYTYHTPVGEEFPSEQELYDLNADPGEFDNLAGRPDYAGTIKKMHAALISELGEEPDESEQRCLADFARGYGR